MSRVPLFPESPRPLTFAHRGYSARAPENTMPAFREAAEAGVPGIELDVRLSRDGVPVVIHDPDLLRLAGSDATIAELTVAELAEADVGSWLSREFAGTGIPTLAEVFDTFGERFYYDIEIKHRSGDPNPLIHAVLHCVAERSLEGCVLVSSFHPKVVALVRGATRAFPVALIFSAHKDVPRTLRRGQGRFFARPDVLKPYWGELLRPTARTLGRLDSRPRLVWTVDGEEAVEAIRGKQVEGIISNDPNAALSALRADVRPDRQRASDRDS
ncbi:MAG: glycerophosphodiester phosphodiesterase [Spirochaetaceae bacterium]